MSEESTGDPPDEAIRRARRLLADARRVVVLTGAGVSAASGVPTFRGEDGLWKEHSPQELATPSAFRRDPRLVWEWYAWRRSVVSGCDPNPAHLTLARRTSRPDARIVTQNVDALHTEALRRPGSEQRRATPGSGPPASRPPPDADTPDGTEPPVESSGRHGGADATGSGSDVRPDPLFGPPEPIELHGSLFRVRCTACDHTSRHREEVDATSRETLPSCPACSSLLRPDVVWFGESLDPAVLDAARGLAARCDVCLVVGTSAVVQPAASLAEVARRAGAELVEVNPEPTPVSRSAAVALRADAARVIPRILDPEPGAADRSPPEGPP